MALEYADKSFRSDRDVVLAAVTQDGMALNWADGSFKSDRDVVLAAVTQNGRVLNYVNSLVLRQDPHILAAASNQNLKLAARWLRHPPGYHIKDMIGNYGQLLFFYIYTSNKQHQACLWANSA